MAFLDFLDREDNFVFDEEDLQLLEYLGPFTRRERVLRTRPDHFTSWDELDFKRRFRIDKDSFRYMLSLIQDKISHDTERNHCITPMNQLLIALRFYATGSFYITVGDFAGIHNSTICKIIKRVTAAIAEMRTQFINLPENQNEINSLQLDFYDIASFPKVVAAIDCTHIRITSPGGDTAENFRNRKGYFSLNVQALCSAKLKFLDIVARWPGSTHDSLIFSNSAVKYKFDSRLFGNSLILGDKGYFSNNYMVTPLNETHTPAECLFNEAQIRSRNVIERSFGVWKRRFPVLSIGLRCRLPLVQDIIVATAILHNVCIEKNDSIPPTDPEVLIIPDPVFEDVQQDGPIQNSTREQLIEYFSTLANNID